MATTKKLTKKALEKYASLKFWEVFGEPDDWPDWYPLTVYIDENAKDGLTESDIDDFIAMCLDEYRDAHWKRGMEMPKAWNGKAPKKSG